MNWDAIGAVGEILGAIAVLITLIYLATQVRRSNELSRFNASKEVMNQFNDLNHLVTTDSSLRQLLMKEGQLTADEREQLCNFAMMFCNVWMSVQIAYDNDQIDKSLYDAGAKDVSIELARWPNFRSAAEQWLANYPENAHYEIMQPVLSGNSSEDNGNQNSSANDT